jgi:hypothetical protein
MYLLRPGSNDWSIPPRDWPREELGPLGEGKKSLSDLVAELAATGQFCWLVFEKDDWERLTQAFSLIGPSGWDVNHRLAIYLRHALNVDALPSPLSLAGKLKGPEADFVQAVRLCGTFEA